MSNICFFCSMCFIILNMANNNFNSVSRLYRRNVHTTNYNYEECAKSSTAGDVQTT